jgi:hypothetical protein
MRYLDPIARPRLPNDFTQSLSQMFPPGITREEIKLPKRSDALLCLTFPWKKAMSERKLYKMAFVCQVIKARLRKVISEKMKLAYGADVSYEFPFYPHLNNPWISIRFRSDLSKIEPIKQLILEELKVLQQKGVDESLLVEVKELEKSRDEFRLRDNFYWVSMLGNYYLWHWDPEWIVKSSILTQEIQPAKVNSTLERAFSLENYSQITGKP